MSNRSKIETDILKEMQLAMDFVDTKMILEMEGNITGFTKVYKVHEISRNIFIPLRNKLKFAKGVLVIFDIHTNVSLFIVKDLMGSINRLVNKDTEINFATKANDLIEKNSLKLSIVISGLSNEVIAQSEDTQLLNFLHNNNSDISNFSYIEKFLEQYNHKETSYLRDEIEQLVIKNEKLSDYIKKLESSLFCLKK
ncbi:MAG: hypothetical protein WC141_01545 [Arcobacteraceae bacterium]